MLLCPVRTYFRSEQKRTLGQNPGSAVRYLIGGASWIGLESFLVVFREIVLLLLPAIRTGRSHRFTSRGPIFRLYLYSLDGEFLPQLGLTLPGGIPLIFEPILTFRLVFRLSNESVDWFV